MPSRSDILSSRIYDRLPDEPSDILLIGPDVTAEIDWLLAQGHRVTVSTPSQQEYNELAAKGVSAVKESPTRTSWPDDSFAVVLALGIPLRPSGINANPYLVEAQRVARTGGWVLWTTGRLPEYVNDYRKPHVLHLPPMEG